MKRYFIAIYSKDINNKFIFSGVLSGCGKHKNTLDYDHSRSAAYRYAREMKLKNDGNQYKVEEV